jgi:hypothetical protein
MDSSTFFRDYGAPFATAIAIVSANVSLVFSQFFKDSRKIALVTISCLFGAIAIFGAFYSAYESGVATKAESQKRLAMKNLLGSAIETGVSLTAKQWTESEIDANAFKSDAEAWATRTYQLIEGAYGKGEAERFVNNAGITIYGSGPQQHPSVLANSWMSARIQRLNELMPRVETIVMVSDFDPSKHTSK